MAADGFCCCDRCVFLRRRAAHRGQPLVTAPQQHQIDNQGQTLAVSVAIQMSAAPAYQETEPEEEQLPPPQESPSQAELATARRKTPEKTTKPPSAKPAVNAVNKKTEKSEPITTKTTADTGEDKTTQQQSGGQAVSPTNSATAGADNRKVQEDYFNLLRQKIEEQKHYPRRARSARRRGSAPFPFLSTITANLLHRSLPALPVMNYWITPQWMLSSGLLLSVRRRQGQNGG